MRGSFLYDGTVSCELCIVRSSVRYGTGDWEDEADIAEDVEVDTYYLYYNSPADPTRFNAAGGCYESLAEAMAAAERAPGIGATVKWAQHSVQPDARDDAAPG